MDEKYFKKFANIHTIEDVLKAKEILKEIYFSEDIDVIVKISILTTLSEFVTKEDMSFYIEVSQKAFNEAKEVFLHLLINREKKDTGSVSELFSKVEDIYYLDEEFNKHSFSISIAKTVEIINIQYKNFEIDNWLYDGLSNLFLEINNIFYNQ